MIKKIGRYLILFVCGISIGFVVSKCTKEIFLQQIYIEDNHLITLQQPVAKAKQLIETSGTSLKSKDIKFPKLNEQYAIIHNDKRGFKKNLYWGDSDYILDISIGQYANSGIPGQGKPLLMAGHNGTHFKLLPTFQKGDLIQIDTSYGSYSYEVYDMKTIHKSEFKTSELDKDEEILMLYTCYPFHVITTDYRYFVYAKFVDGPLIEEDGTWKK